MPGQTVREWFLPSEPAWKRTFFPAKPDLTLNVNQTFAKCFLFAASNHYLQCVTNPLEQVAIGLNRRELRKLFFDCFRSVKKNSKIRFAQHGRVVEGIAGRDHF